MAENDDLATYYSGYKSALNAVLDLVLTDGQAEVQTEDVHRYHLLQGLIRPVIELSKSGLLLLDSGYIFAANIVARSAFEHAVYAQSFYLQADGNAHLEEKYNHSVRDVFQNELFTVNDTAKEMYANLKIPDIDKTSSFVTNFSRILYRSNGDQKLKQFVESDELMKTYYILSQYVHPLAGFHLYIREKPDGSGPMIGAKSNDNFGLHSLHVFLNATLMVVVVEEDLKIGKPKLERIYELAHGVGIFPWLHLSDPIK